MYRNRKFLLMYITLNSGHHRASIAIENAIKYMSPDAETFNINALAYTNPISEKVINQTYLGVIKNRPEVWEYLYDNPKVLKSVQGMRDAIHKFNSKKLKLLIEDFNPDIVICTQAFPCGMIADYKKSFQNMELGLVGVLTDHAPHSYWIFENVDYYITPSDTSKDVFIKNGIAGSKIKVYGIPIDPKFSRPFDKTAFCKKIGLDPEKPTILIMGGSQGLGPVEKIVDILNRIDLKLQILIVCGINRRLSKKLLKKAGKSEKKMLVYEFTDNIDELMGISDIIVTKPGGLTTAEALSKELPMIIVHPLPGQESKNSDFLLREGVAVKAEDSQDIAALVQELLSNRTKLDEMKHKTVELKKPNAAFDIARLVLDM